MALQSFPGFSLQQGQDVERGLTGRAFRHGHQASLTQIRSMGLRRPGAVVFLLTLAEFGFSFVLCDRMEADSTD